MPQLNIVLMLLILLVSFATAFVYFKCVATLWKPSVKVLYVPVLVGAVVMATITLIGISILNEPFAYITYTIVCLFLVLIFFRITLAEAFFVSLIYVFQTMCLKGLVAGIISLLVAKNTFQLFSLDFYALLITGIADFIKLMVFVYITKEVKKDKYRVFFSSEAEVLTILFTHVGIFLFMLFHSYNYYYNLDLIWFSISQVLVSALMFIVYVLVFNYGIRSANMIQRELWSKHAQDQMLTRIAQHDVYLRAFKDIDKFKHEYRELMVTVDYLLQEKRQEELYTLLTTSFPSLVISLPTSKQFSNHPLIDAALFDWNNICEREGIELNSMVYVPMPFDMDDYSMTQFFQCVQEISMTLARGAFHKNHRATISMEGKVANQWLTIKSTASFAGLIETKDDLPYFLTANALDLKSKYILLQRLTEEDRGMCSFFVDNARQEFSLILSRHVGKFKE